MSEKMSHNSQSSTSIEKFKAKQEAALAEKQEEMLLERIFGESLIGDGLDDGKRVREGSDYYNRLEEMSKRDDDFDYDPDSVDQKKEGEIAEAIESIPKLRSLNTMAERISNAYKGLDPLDSLQVDGLKRDELGRLRERFASTFERYSELGFDSRAESDNSVDQQEFLDNFNYYNNRGLIKDSLVRILDKADFSDLLTEASHDQALSSENVSDGVKELNVSSDGLADVGKLADVIEAIRAKKSEEREADITDYVVALRQIAIDLRNLRTKATRNSSPGVELQIDLQEKAFERAYDSLEDFYGDEDPRVLESLLNLAYDPPSSVENIEPKPENTKDSDELIQQDPKLRKLAIDLSTMPLYNWTVEQHPLREGLTEDISEKSSEAIADESDVVAPIVEADASSAETTEAQSKSEVENINDRIENVINDEYRETLGKLRELAHELYEAWRTSDPSYNDKLDYFNEKTSQIEDMFNLGYIEGDIESKEELADIKKAINRIKTEAGFDGLDTLRGLLRHLQNDKFKDRYGYDFARDNYLSERKNIINSLNNLNKKDPEVAAERKHIRNVLKELDSEFKNVEPYIRDENKVTDKVKNKVKGAFETSPNVIATNELKNNLKDRFKGFVNTIGSGLKDFANYTPSERLAGETNRDYRARLSSESNSKFMSMAAIAKTIVPRR